jgi:hypothetical protein
MNNAKVTAEDLVAKQRKSNKCLRFNSCWMAGFHACIEWLIEKQAHTKSEWNDKAMQLDRIHSDGWPGR